MPRPKRECAIDGKKFQPRAEARFHLHPEPVSKDCPWCQLCPECRGLKEIAATAPAARAQLDFTVPPEERLDMTAPMRQCVFDLETWGLDRGWGVTLVGSMLVHGGPEGPEWFNFDAREQSTWPDRRSQDKELVEKVIGVLQTCDIAYAHNGEFFDIRWLRTVALKYNLRFPTIKLVDPARIAWNKYRLGRNSLEAVADFLELPYSKMHIPNEVWRRALLDNSQPDFETLRERCKSDVQLLNAVASHVVKDVGLIDTKGSGR